LQAAIFQTVELHEYIVPDLDHLRMIIVHQVFFRNGFSFFIGTAIHMDLGAWAAWTGIAHLPEIIFFVAKWQDPVFCNYFFPFVYSFFIFGNPSFSSPFKNGYV
jgi:hypothetical protein